MSTSLQSFINWVNCAFCTGDTPVRAARPLCPQCALRYRRHRATSAGGTCACPHCSRVRVKAAQLGFELPGPRRPPAPKPPARPRGRPRKDRRPEANAKRRGKPNPSAHITTERTAELCANMDRIAAMRRERLGKSVTQPAAGGMSIERLAELSGATKPEIEALLQKWQGALHNAEVRVISTPGSERLPPWFVKAGQDVQPLIIFDEARGLRKLDEDARRRLLEGDWSLPPEELDPEDKP